MDSAQRTLMIDNNIDIDTAIERFGNNEELYLKYFHSFVNDNTYKQFKESFKVDKLWQSQNILITFIGIVGNLGFVKLYEYGNELLKAIKGGNASNAVLALDKLDSSYENMLNFIRNVNI